MATEIQTRRSHETVTQDLAPHHHPIRQRLSEKEFRELLVAEKMINHGGDAPNALRRGAIGVLRELEELLQRPASPRAARRVPDA